VLSHICRNASFVVIVAINEIVSVITAIKNRAAFHFAAIILNLDILISSIVLLCVVFFLVPRVQCRAVCRPMGYDRKRHYNAAAADRGWVDDGSRSAKESRAMSSQPESLMMKSSDVTGDVTLPQQLLSWQQAPSVHDSAWHSVLQTMTASAAEPLSWLPPPSSTQH